MAGRVPGELNDYVVRKVGTAAAQFLLERRLFAQFWLRRAAQVAPDERLRAEAVEWRQSRGAMSGRVAWQFFCDLAGREGVAL